MATLVKTVNTYSKKDRRFIKRSLQTGSLVGVCFFIIIKTLMLNVQSVSSAIEIWYTSPESRLPVPGFNKKLFKRKIKFEEMDSSVKDGPLNLI